MRLEGASFSFCLLKFRQLKAVDKFVPQFIHSFLDSFYCFVFFYLFARNYSARLILSINQIASVTFNYHLLRTWIEHELTKATVQ